MFSTQVTELLKSLYSFLVLFEKIGDDYKLYKLQLSNKHCKYIKISFIYGNQLVQILLDVVKIQYSVIDEHFCNISDQPKGKEIIVQIKELTYNTCENLRSNIIFDQLQKYIGYIEINFVTSKSNFIDIIHEEYYLDKCPKKFEMTRKEADFYLL